MDWQTSKTEYYKAWLTFLVSLLPILRRGVTPLHMFSIDIVACSQLVILAVDVDSSLRSTRAAVRLRDIFAMAAAAMAAVMVAVAAVAVAAAQVLYNNFIPISMYVTVEMVVFTLLNFVNNDASLYLQEIDMPAKVRAVTVEAPEQRTLPVTVYCRRCCSCCILLCACLRAPLLTAQITVRLCVSAWHWHTERIEQCETGSHMRMHVAPAMSLGNNCGSRTRILLRILHALMLV
jgi:hypothetical protein